MVLEQIYPLNWLSRRPIAALLLGLTYSLLGMTVAIALFPEDPALVAVALTAILLVPSMRGLIKHSEREETEELNFSIPRLYQDHRAFFLIYLCAFVGIFLTFAFFAAALPALATNHLFEQQVNVLAGNIGGKAVNSTGGAILSTTTLKSIFFNNVLVLIFCFVTALLFGDAAIFLITWNASVWGTIFGILAKHGATYTGKNPFIYLFIILVCVTPHMLLEASAYVLSAIAGATSSRAIIKEGLLSENFARVLRDSLLIFCISIMVLISAAIVEAIVLHQVTVYQIIWKQAFFS